VFTGLADGVQFLLNLQRFSSEPFERLASRIPSSMASKPGWRFRGEEHAKKQDRAMKITARSLSVLFRPSASFIGPEQSAPMMAPINPALTAISSCVGLRGKAGMQRTASFAFLLSRMQWCLQGSPGTSLQARVPGRLSHTTTFHPSHEHGQRTGSSFAE